MSTPEPTTTPSTPAFQPGDAVQWTVVKSSRGGFTFSRREGKIESVHKDSAIVKSRNGQRRRMPLDELDAINARSGPARLLEALAGESAPESTPAS